MVYKAYHIHNMLTDAKSQKYILIIIIIIIIHNEHNA